MTDKTFYQKYRAFIALFNALTIAVTSGFGILYLLIATEHSVLYSQVVSYVVGSVLGIIYVLTERQNFLYREKLEEVDN